MSSEYAFYHVYELPEKLSNGFCHNGGNPIAFLNVDFFEDASPAFGKALLTEEEIGAFVRTKRYVKPGKRYLVVGTPGVTFTIEAK